VHFVDITVSFYIEQTLSCVSCCTSQIYRCEWDQLDVAKHASFILLNLVTLKTRQAQKYCLKRLTNHHWHSYFLLLNFLLTGTLNFALNIDVFHTTFWLTKRIE